MVDEDTTLPRLADGGSSFARTLVRSAKFDVPRQGAEAALAERLSLRLHAEDRSPQRRTGLGIAVALAAVSLAAVAFLVRGQSREVELTREPASVAMRATTGPELSLDPSKACTRSIVASGTAPLIDDMEDQNARFALQEGRDGSWALADGSFPFPVPIPERRDGSRYALYLSGGQSPEGLNLRGALVDNRPPRACYDASRYAGVEFWARGKQRIYVKLGTIDTMSVDYGGYCIKDCYDTHQQAIDLGPEWVHYRIAWSEFEQAGWGKAERFDPARLISVDFMVSAADTPFEYWLDDVAFLRAESGESPSKGVSGAP